MKRKCIFCGSEVIISADGTYCCTNKECYACFTPPYILVLPTKAKEAWGVLIDHGFGIFDKYHKRYKERNDGK